MFQKWRFGQACYSPLTDTKQLSLTDIQVFRKSKRQPDFPENVGRVFQATLQAGDWHPLRIYLGGHECPQGRRTGGAFS